MATFVLVHSPLVGPLTWSQVAEQFRSKGIAAIAPALPDALKISPPYWRRHAEAVAQVITAVAANEAIVLVGHSGGGVILPAIREISDRPVAAYIFVDAGIPQDGKSRLDFFGESEREQFRANSKDGLLSAWTEEDLVNAISDPDSREHFVQELNPLPLVVYEEPIRVFAGWPDAPCGYIQFTATYQEPAEKARQHGWTYRKLDGGHFLMLNDPALVTTTLIDTTNEMLSPNPQNP